MVLEEYEKALKDYNKAIADSYSSAYIFTIPWHSCLL